MTTGSSRIAVDEATFNLRRWELSSDSIVPAQASVHLIQEVAIACKAHQVRVSFSVAARALANCAFRKAVDGSEAEFNLALRGLISLVDTLVSSEKTNLGSNMAFRSLSFLLTNLGNTDDSRVKIPLWVLRELHDLTDALSKRYDRTKGAWQQYLITLSRLYPDEILGILRGSPERQHRQSGYIHSLWESVILDAIRARGSEHEAVSAQSAAVALWVKSNELSEAIGRFEQLTSEYIRGSGQHTPRLLASLTKDIRLALAKNPSG